ncbi:MULTISPECIES: hypothetical protein [Pseudomonas]|uniref:Transmembrane protein n=2 Tax=Pseudomonas TaxID=286 RepID=A0A3G1DGD2_PSEAI|nr:MULTISPECIES: hypothetical protein [Pseudomonas]MCO6692629.1 hypothetical protein [Pseudomonas shirazica]AMP35702.1 Hypothetical protein [Pseudomonas aeruginosa]MCZ9640401.1 hypothetical protein [Pseudomonas putida]TRZ57685.1 hypothetical protein DZA28_28370 [Pseudomonas alloputida]HEE9763544.1 hypothetical protein [Pseudomonas putida]
MSDFDSSSEYFARAADTAGEGKLTFRGLFVALLGLYGIFAAVSIFALYFKVPVSGEDLQHASWMVTAPSILPIIYGVLLVLSIMLALQLISPMTISVAVLMASFTGGISPSASLRSAVLAGEAKIGCYEYTSRACTEMLGLPSRAANPDQSAQPSVHQFIPVQAMAFLRAPFDVFKADQLNQMLDTQRLELKEEIRKGLVIQTDTLPTPPTTNQAGEHHE